MDVDFEREFKLKRSDDLLYMLKNSTEYTNEAIAQAKRELENRKIGLEELSHYEDCANERVEFEQRKKVAPLTLSDKICLSIIPFGWKRFVLMNFISNGYEAKYAEANEKIGFYMLANIAVIVAFVFGAFGIMYLLA